MDFYERVKILSKKNNISLTSFLQSLGINYETYKSAKRLNNLPRADEAVKIASALNTSVEFLVTGGESASQNETFDPYKEKFDRLVKAIKALPV